MRRAVVYDVILPGTGRSCAEQRISETASLLDTFGGIVVCKVIQRRHHTGSCSFVGRGKLNELIDISGINDADLLIVNNALKPAQLYALQETIENSRKKIEVWDRVDLILKIFQKHARSAEAKLQVRLACLNHLGLRIYDMSEELGREGGGSRGGAANKGVGETNTEIMKRYIAEQKRLAKKKIDSLQASRELNRKRRQKNGLQTVSIIGYTNAGKSSIFQNLTSKRTYIENKLFATLDTLTGLVYLPQLGCEVLLADTIGFIRDLPPKLIDAFRSTLEETRYADILLHAVDSGDPDAELHIESVNKILDEIGCGEIPRIFVFTKIDIAETSPMVRFCNYNGVFVSSVDKSGFSELKNAICAALTQKTVIKENCALPIEPEVCVCLDKSIHSSERSGYTSIAASSYG